MKILYSVKFDWLMREHWNKFRFKSAHEIFIVESRQWVYGCSTFCLIFFPRQMLRWGQGEVGDVKKNVLEEVGLKYVFASHNICLPGPPKHKPLCPWLCFPVWALLLHPWTTPSSATSVLTEWRHWGGPPGDRACLLQQRESWAPRKIGHFLCWGDYWRW